MVITTRGVNEELIDDFIETMDAHDNVASVTRQYGRVVKVVVTRTDFSVPYPHHELGPVDDGVVKGDDYIVGRLAGGGSAPGDKYAHNLYVSPYCDDCGDRGVTDDDGLCRVCKYQWNLR